MNIVQVLTGTNKDTWMLGLQQLSVLRVDQGSARHNINVHYIARGLIRGM